MGILINKTENFDKDLWTSIIVGLTSQKDARSKKGTIMLTGPIGKRPGETNVNDRARNQRRLNSCVDM